MTVCIAAICEDGKKIVVAAGRMFTAGAPVNLAFETEEHGDRDYLRNRLTRCQQEKGKDKFYR